MSPHFFDHEFLGQDVARLEGEVGGHCAQEARPAATQNTFERKKDMLTSPAFGGIAAPLAAEMINGCCDGVNLCENTDDEMTRSLETLALSSSDNSPLRGLKNESKTQAEIS